jgi:hypothetical protein
MSFLNLIKVMELIINKLTKIEDNRLYSLVSNNCYFVTSVHDLDT